MKVKYSIIVDITADGMLGPKRVLDLVSYALYHHLTVTMEVADVRLGAVYPLAQAVKEGVDPGMQASDPGGPHAYNDCCPLGGHPNCVKCGYDKDHPLHQAQVVCKHDDGSPACT